MTSDLHTLEPAISLAAFRDRLAGQKATLDDLRQLHAGGLFHHATVHAIGQYMIWVYAVNPNGFRGYELVFALPDDESVHEFLISIGHGVSVGAYGVG